MAVSVDHCIYTLRIENFDLIQTLRNSTELPDFACSTSSTILWYARLNYQYGKIGVLLFGKSKKKETVKVHFELSIVDVEGERHRALRQEDFFREKQTWGDDAYVDFEFIVEQPDRFLPGNVLTLRLEIIISEPGNAPEKDWMDFSSTGDFTVHCGNEEFAVHRNVMCARSSRFKQLFEDPHLTSCCITDTEPGILKEMIRYAYTGMCSDFPVGLYEAAESYGLSGFTDMVSLKRIYRTVQVDTEDCKVVWHVSNFDVCGDVVLSPVFNTGECYVTNWHLVLRLEADSVRIHLKRISSTRYRKEEQYLVNYKISLLDTSGHARYFSAGQCVSSYDGRSFKCTDFPRKEVLLTDATLFLPDNTLVICFEMMSANGDFFFGTEYTEFLFKACHESEDTHTIKLCEVKGVQTGDLDDSQSQTPDTAL